MMRSENFCCPSKFLQTHVVLKMNQVAFFGERVWWLYKVKKVRNMDLPVESACESF